MLMSRRYVQELVKLNETFCHALLPSSTRSPSLNLFNKSNTLSRNLSPTSVNSAVDSPDHLPIAAQYTSAASPYGDRPQAVSSAEGRMDAYHALTNGRPSHQGSANSLNAKGRAHHSMPPPSRTAIHSGAASVLTFHRKSFQPRIGSASSDNTSFNGQDVHLPEDLEEVLAVLAGGILEGHIKLAAALRRRYEDQYPLVRSLADVFTTHVRFARYLLITKADSRSLTSSAHTQPTSCISSAPSHRSTKPCPLTLSPPPSELPGV